MPVILAMFFGLAAGAAAFFLGAVLASVAAAVFHMSNMEGATGYFAAAIGALAGLAGMIVTMIFTLRRHGVTNFAAVLGGTFAAIAGIAAVAAACFWLYYMSIPHYIHPHGPPVYLNFEIAPPPGAGQPDFARWSTELHTSRNAAIGYWNSDTRDLLEGRPVTAGHVELHYRTSQRELVLYLPNEEKRTFLLSLPGDPTGPKYRQWSEWRKPVGSSDYRIRYLVETNDRP